MPYYIWVGCSKDHLSSRAKLAEIDAAATESPYLSALDLQTGHTQTDVEVRSKAYESAIINLQSSLPLPATWYVDLRLWGVSSLESRPNRMGMGIEC
jgi:betaine lipid synthase